jgi:hypothetical protein
MLFSMNQGTWILLAFTLMILSLFGTFFYSYQSRKAQGSTKILFRAYMNLSMGVLFLSIGLQLSMLTLPTLGTLFVVFILAVGGINLYYGFKQRNWALKQKGSDS